MSENAELLKLILNDSNQLVHVCDLESLSIVYANDAARNLSIHPEAPYQGQPCYKYMMGLDEQCPFCPLRRLNGSDSFEEEVDIGQKIFAVKVKLTEWNGRKAFIEYSSDITAIRKTERNYERQLNLLMVSIPDSLGFFHLDLTADCILGHRGVENLISFEVCKSVDDVAYKMSEFVQGDSLKHDFVEKFCRKNLQKMFVDGNVSFDFEANTVFKDDSVHYCRVCARLLMNPRNSHLECVVYSLDVSKEKAVREFQLNVVSALSRDFRNVYLVDLEKNEISVVKLDGYLTRGLDDDPKKRFPYDVSCARYIEDRVHPEDKLMMTSAMSIDVVRAALQHDDEYIGVYRILEKGETHYYQFKYVHVENSPIVVAGFQNVDSMVSEERKRQEELLLLQENDLFRKKVLGSLALIYFGVFYIDLSSEHFIEMTNTEEASVNEFIGDKGNAREKFVTMSKFMVYPDQAQLVLDFTNLDTLPERLSGRDSISFHFNGSYVGWCEGMFIAVERDSNGRCTKVLWTVRSIRDEIAKEEDYKNQLKIALQKAKQANSAKSAFLARMSHDIRTPLNGILGLLELEEKKDLDQETRASHRKKAKIAANHLLSLLSDVLELSKLDDSDTVLVEEPFNLLQVLSEIYTIAMLRADENCVSVLHDNSVNLKYLDLFGSPLHIRQIFLNLLTNAIKYNKKGGSVYCHSEIVEESPDKVVYCFHVEDNGIGMKDEFLKHIFEPFVQEHSDARSTFQGAGMGMAIVKRLVDKMNGSITVQSELGKGSRFAVTLPFRINKNPQKQESESLDNVSVEGMKVLLVEDNELNMEVARGLLEDMGVVVSCAVNGAEAVEFFEQVGEGNLDLILMDLMMPVLDGYGASQKIRLSSKKDATQIPIVALSANAFEEDVRKAKDAGMNSLLAKPINLALLQRTLARYKK